MTLESTERLRVEQELRQALSEEAIRPFYQPLIHLGDGSVHGFEALARWRNHKGEFVPPSLFIDIAENAGLITELFDQLLRRACRDALTWPSSMVLAFNLSPTQLSDGLLGQRVVEILEETGLPPERLEIELTESAVVKEMNCAMRVIGDLRRIGIKIALDDFGTGFSSLSQLANIPFDKIKIDRSFVASFETNSKQMKIVRSIVGLGQGLGAATLAEGIELESQYKGLSLLGCEYGQGFLFAKAMPASEVAAFLASARSEWHLREPFRRTA
ncbi:putative bifunctional diguanylate cyclase/phosphodiesterase [Fulvimarina manganoxydans]|uniref:putative bifunctional diguanylate cyclase/phosphodiesterase n=1 Tax=Fulvimarina manganoxydans TaxID=937218 RepID=UPI002353B906|nr:EAL domain-containing protein [Fulvimarina manganoxydans]